MVRKIDAAQPQPYLFGLRNLNERRCDPARVAVQVHLREHDAFVLRPKNIVVYRYSHRSDAQWARLKTPLARRFAWRPGAARLILRTAAQRQAIYHNILWSKYKGVVFSQVHLHGEPRGI